MKEVGKEIISGYQGGVRATSASFSQRANRLTVRRGGRYPAGISRGRSPGGKPYDPLTKTTKKMRKKAGAAYLDAPLMERGYSALDSLINQLRMRIYVKGDGVEVKFKDADMNKISKIHEEGRLRYPSQPMRNNPDLYLKKRGTDKPIMVQIPARPHRGVQPAVGVAIKKILRAWVNR